MGNQMLPGYTSRAMCELAAELKGGDYLDYYQYMWING